MLQQTSTAVFVDNNTYPEKAMNSVSIYKTLGALACSFFFVSGASAKPASAPPIVELIVPYSPGGASDTMARVIAPALQKATGSQIVVVNKPGANGAIAGAYVARSEHNGSRILLADLAIALNPILRKATPYNVEKNFSPIALLGTGAFVLYVPASGPATLNDFLAPNGKDRTIAHSGVGSLGHLAAELLQQKTHRKIISVAYQGAGPAMTATVGGQVDAMFGSTASGMGMVQNGTLKALAVADHTRLPGYPDVPTFAELGVDGVYAVNWWGLIAPAGTPKDIVDWLYDGARQVLDNQQVKDQLKRIEVTPTLKDAQAYKDLISHDVAQWESVVSQAGIKID
ncbi:Bug family tripartite tricarboxylate transporter substrate binding protein [Candidimonas nitroreducens]|uniref:Bug family tripartite tricarboxylate transporter substrate binding protein n=1 Tax=Candidimonas nitroreducens TaxID=683354 RepID=UPI0013034F8F|nr:tripartite tricarboxylate transporter substrate binding protein [Candidimonas nitroreducens]